VLRDERIVQAFVNSALISTLATLLSLMVTVTSGYMLSRFRGALSRAWFGTIYVFRCVPYISWVLPLYFVTQAWGIYDSYPGLLLPHIAVHICFFSWLMKGFFDAIDPSMSTPPCSTAARAGARSCASRCRRRYRPSPPWPSSAGSSRGTSSSSH